MSVLLRRGGNHIGHNTSKLCLIQPHHITGRQVCPPVCVLSAGLKNFPIPRNYDHVEIPEQSKLKFYQRVPDLVKHVREPRGIKMLRGPADPEQTVLIGKQYGIKALSPGLMRWGHFEMIRLTINRRMDTKTMWAKWRIEAPYKPLTKKGQGHRMGGGKGAIDHYVTPIKQDRIIVEMGGKIDFEVVHPMLREIAQKLPFQAKVVTQEMLEEEEREEEWRRENNQNEFTFEDVVKKNMMGCSQHISKYDREWFGKYQ
ncbi:39S ribosomal protein L16, mitochondrial-like [Branchiostoma floridae]|uniref:Large ribosomal subunit protein uL16m n=2 Tax=Branchiostoma floridae TaxID=7739 RepID=A0A9J7LY56_BRAFL|nr:39S ribosomal protein L16, mitochondrial-like [Branchiostoma floridae]